MSLMPIMVGSGVDSDGNSVRIPSSVDFGTFGTGGTVYSGVKFDSDGSVYRRQANGGWSRVGSWLYKGSAGSYYLARTINAGSLTTDSGAGPNLPFDGTDYIYDVQQSMLGSATAEVSFQIASHLSGTPIVAGPIIYYFEAEVESEEFP